MDEPHLLLATRYIERNPVKEGIVNDPGSYRWSSAAAHLSEKDDRLPPLSPQDLKIVSYTRSPQQA